MCFISWNYLASSDGAVFLEISVTFFLIGAGLISILGMGGSEYASLGGVGIWEGSDGKNGRGILSLDGISLKDLSIGWI